jgi:hypothetical protein
MRDDEYDENRRIAPVWRRIMILLAVIAAVPVVLWSITVFVRAYVAPPTVPTFRPITASASTPAPTASAPTVPARALAAIVRNAATEEARLPVNTGSIVEARATATDARSLAPLAEGRRPVSESLGVVPEADASPAPAEQPVAPSPWPATVPAAVAAPPEQPSEIVAETEDVPPGEPLVGPVPLPPHRPHVLAMAPGAIPVPRPRPSGTGDAAPTAPADANLSARDYMN